MLSYRALVLTSILIPVLASCTPTTQVVKQQPTAPPVEQGELANHCDAAQATFLQQGDQRAAPYSVAEHLRKNFADHKVSWLMKDGAYQKFIVQTQAKNFGRCSDSGCYLFVAPAAVIHDAVKQSMSAGKHDPAILGKALGLPAANFDGPLRMMTLDLNSAAACARLPVDSDPGVWKCQSDADKDCFKFGGYTSGGVPELMVVGAPVDKAQVEEVP